MPLRVRSFVGLIPLFASAAFDPEAPGDDTIEMIDEQPPEGVLEKVRALPHVVRARALAF